MLAFVVGLLGLELFLTSVAVSFTSRDSLIRFAILPVIVLATYQVMAICASGKLASSVARAVLGSGSVYRVIHYVGIVLLDGWTFNAKGPTSSLGGLVPAAEPSEKTVHWSWGSIGERLRFGIRVSTTTRFSTTRWSVRYVPPFDNAKPGFVPSRSEFLWRRPVQVGVLGCMLSVTGWFAQKLFREQATMFWKRHIPIFSRIPEVTLAELGIRVVGVLAYWTMQYLSLSFLYGFLSVVMVAIGLSDVEEWPPVFGPLGEAWSIAQFWGCFYHQNIRRGCSGIAHFLTYHCLRLSENSMVGRYTFITCVFAISGVFHLLSDLARGIPKYESNAMHFFLVQPLGICLERIVQSLYSRLAPSKTDSSKLRASPNRFGCLVGYGWVLFWIVWTSPVWIFTSMKA
ncbi:Putative Wax synthase domain-containing protein [Colletotrichum destructivum]|uniref:Wax synthase domain-containing protein n=1 Tax=Colletotrichum destructivum TaxID=34406 RepID=A0AAX4IBQ5_9PEZI|nr:Putative Wax synthase domain-containing protein [Colletotrichum destructivum]